LLGQASELFKQGDEFGDNTALAEAIDLFRRDLTLAPRSQRPLDWAMTQMNLGNALRILGERDSGTARLEEAVSAFREALQENTRARAPLQWAMTQMNLGSALFRLGERETGTARLEEAVAAFREALQEQTRARVPLLWAMTQVALGTALFRLGERETGTARLEEAVFASRDALQENTRARVPLQWAATQMNLGNALRTLGERESGTARLEEAVAAYREALQESTRARAAPMGQEHRQSRLRPHAARRTARRCQDGEAGGPTDRGGFCDNARRRRCAFGRHLRSTIAKSPRACPKARQALRGYLKSLHRTQALPLSGRKPEVPLRAKRSAVADAWKRATGEKPEGLSRRMRESCRCGKQTCDRRTTSPGAFKQLRGSASPLRSDL
jgi:tetratricopeptide (TPR) repeat protein